MIENFIFATIGFLVGAYAMFRARIVVYDIEERRRESANRPVTRSVVRR